LSLRPSPQPYVGPRARHPFFRRYGANLPNSLARHNPRRLRLLTQGTSVGSGYGRQYRQSPHPPFHCPRDSGEPAKAGHSCLHWGLTITVLPQLQQLDGAYAPLTLSRGVRGCEAGLKPTSGIDGTGILTGFPFGEVG